MSVAVAVDTLTNLLLVAWIGGHAALGGFAARIAFRELPRPLAAQMMTQVFHEFDALIMVALVLLAALTLGRVWLVRGRSRAHSICLWTGALLVMLGCFEVLWLHPHIEQLFSAGRTLEPQFGSLHRLSARCANVEIALAAILFAAQARTRAPSPIRPGGTID